mmetsp:Transcript_56589/g.132768  ORF Transcript_56589/g.132768 Transcript_56589/m.132768 type:complete len:199 (+) Transcript_56589:195-791(+)
MCSRFCPSISAVPTLSSSEGDRASRSSCAPGCSLNRLRVASTLLRISANQGGVWLSSFGGEPLMRGTSACAVEPCAAPCAAACGMGWRACRGDHFAGMEGDLFAWQDPAVGGDFAADGGRGGVCMAGALGGDGRSARIAVPGPDGPSRTFAEQLRVGCERARVLLLCGNSAAPSACECLCPAGRGGSRADVLAAGFAS